MSYPATWSAVPQQFTNARELVTPPGATTKAAARIFLTAFAYRNHAEAVEQLGEIGNEAEAPIELIQINGWPAVQRVHLVRLPRHGQRTTPGDDTQVMRVTTAIAGGTLLVRLDGTLAPDGDPKLVDEMKAIGRAVVFATPGTPELIQNDMTKLRDALGPALALPSGITPPPRRPPSIDEGPSGEPLDPPAVLVQAGNGELEMAASNDGRNVVMAANSGIAFSNDGGLKFKRSGNGGVQNSPIGLDGDLSVAFGVSGRFYTSFIGFPPNSVSSASTGLSTDNGQNFFFQGNAVVCSQAMGCFTDQPHIAADRRNAGVGGDQLYVVYRNFGPLANAPANSGANIGAVICSSNGGLNWQARPTAVDGGADFPRVSVGRDGSVYTVHYTGRNLRINKFSSCRSGLTQQTGFPRTIVSRVEEPSCPIAGLDRCLGGNVLSSPMVAPDDTDAQHLYVALALNTSMTTPFNEDVLVTDSTDGGMTWSRRIRANANRAARRYLPWVCSTNGVAFVSWYDRRAATTANNDLTDYFAGSVVRRGATLVAGPEVNLTNNPDPQCASGWPCGAEFVNQSTACSVQPQLGGRCQRTPSTNADSNTPCDLRAGFGNCVAPESCQLSGNGCPKYGDYNGNACAAGRAFFAWASATAPRNLAAVNGMSVFAATLDLPKLTVRKVLQPANDPGRFNLRVDSTTRAAAVGNGGSTGSLTLSAGMHAVSETAAPGTLLTSYTRSFSGDCGATGSITLAYGDVKTCTVTNTRSVANCVALCEAQQDACIDQSNETGTPTRAVCVQRFNLCVARCNP